MPRMVVVEHDHDTPPGLLADWAGGRGFTLDVVRLHAGEALPAQAGGWDAAAVLGSAQTAYDDTIGWLAAELAFVRGLVERGTPVLGICFGGQVLARVLGARLYRLPEPEIGLVEVVSKTPALAAGPWPSWHRDAFELPPGAVELAANVVSLQAFAHGPHLGLQFHPEASREIFSAWLDGDEPPTALAGSVTGPGAQAAWQQAAQAAAPLFSAWLDGGLRPA